MYSADSGDYQKPSPGTAATGLPVSSSTPLYTESEQKPQPQPQPRPPRPPKPQIPWSSGLCDCFSDIKNCCMTCWCPCVTFGQISEIVDKGTSSCGQNGALYALIACVTGCPFCYSCFYRSKMRQQYSLREAPCGDCLLHCCCEGCALCQEYRELKNRGYDMSLGWHGNVERQNRGGVSMAPVVHGGMTR